MHDSYRSYFQYETVHNGLCNAHHLRDLIFILEQYHQAWAKEMKALLLEIKDAVAAAQSERDRLFPAQIADFETRYDAIVAAGLQANVLPEPTEPPPKKRGKPKQYPAKNLVDHFQLRKQETLAFMYDCNVPSLCALRVTIIRRNAISEWSNSSRKCQVASARRMAPMYSLLRTSCAKYAVTFLRPARMANGFWRS